jgi:4-amino-4-deoxy-L-arabinose transferase-like glycosyltransferase
MVLVALCCLAAFLGAAWVSSSVFERLPHTEDESAFLFQAQTLASGRLVADAPEFPRAFSIPFIIVRDGMWFGKYPPGYPTVLAAGVLAGQPWLVNATFAALCVLLIYLLARRLYGFPTAILSAMLLTVSPFFLLQSGSLLSHVVSLFWTLLFLLLYPLARSQQGWLLSLATGAALGMLFITRPLTAVGVALPFVLWTLVSIARERRIGRTYLLMLVAVLPFIGGYLAYNDYTTGSPFRTAYELWWPFDHIGFGPEVGINGHDLNDGLRNTRINSNSLASYLFGWPGRSSLVPALAVVLASLSTVSLRAFRRFRKTMRSPQDCVLSPEGWDLMLAGVVLGVMLVHVFYWTPGQMYGPRYFMEAVGPLVILTARCFEQLAHALSVLVARFLPRIRESTTAAYMLAGIVLFGLTLYAHLSWAPNEFDRFRGWNGITGHDLAIVEAYDPSNAVVLVQRDSWTDYAPFFTRNVPSLDGDVVYASNRGSVENQLLMSAYPGRSIYSYGDGRLELIRP